eukprot:GHVS01073117.1.p1 GENE.GHVS01073117.1~~GHVS01073117.1.p1  ORF type:complete len:966 (-),score=126.58 GHVS01073117.1:88-2925(-)
MRLVPRELDCLLVSQVGQVAQRRLARGVLLNQTEAIGLIGCQILELARDGYAVSQLMQKGREMLGFHQVLPGVPELLSDVQVEATFPDGTKLVTVHDPICRPDGDLQLALYGTFLPVPDLSLFQAHQQQQTGLSSTPPPSVHPTTILQMNLVKQHGRELVPGELRVAPGVVMLNEGRAVVTLHVSSHCDRPIQVGSHFHFIEVNPLLEFDRAKALGMRLNIPAGQSIRFEPGQSREVQLVSIGGKRNVYGGNFLVNGKASPDRLDVIMERVKQGGFMHRQQHDATFGYSQKSISRALYCRTYGPTVGDLVSLGDTSLSVRVDRDFAIYGDECKFGGGKVLRDGMGQMSGCESSGCLDVIITNILIIDAITGIVKADVGIKDNKIVGIGKGGNPDIMDGVHPQLIIGAATDAIAGEGLILTAGGIDAHVHFICPQLLQEALSSGLTTLIGGGTGPSAGSCATTCTPGPRHIKDMLIATDDVAVNIGLTGKGNSSCAGVIAADLVEQVKCGAIGLKLHEDWGTTPASIKSCMRVADEFDVQVTIHTDSLNEAGCLEQTLKAIGGRSIHTYHTEGAGGGHAPDIIKVCGEPNVLPSSTNPTRPFTVNTIEEHIDMLMVCHHLDRNLKEDLAFSESRIRAETIQAEDILHDIGAISMISSDSQAMGRIGEVISRTWQSADKMKKQRGALPEDINMAENMKAVVVSDNHRVRRYIAKYTINPAIVHGVSHIVGSVEVGKWADLVIWKPGFFGVKPEMVLKGGQVVMSQMGLANASIPTPEPVQSREMFGGAAAAAANNSLAFVSKLCYHENNCSSWGLRKRIEPVTGCRQVNKSDMILNSCLFDVKVDAETYRVKVRAKPQRCMWTIDVDGTLNKEITDVVSEEQDHDVAAAASVEESVDDGIAHKLKEMVVVGDESAAGTEAGTTTAQYEELFCDPAIVLPLAQRYFLF